MSIETLFADLEAVDRRDQMDAKTYAEHDQDLCMLCGAYGADKRSLVMRYFYELREAVPEMLSLRHAKDSPGNFYYLRTCKRCRGEFLGMMADWRKHCIARRDMSKDHDGNPREVPCGPTIYPVRVFGTIQYMTREELESYRDRKEGGHD